MNLVSDERTETFVDHLVAGNPPFSLKFNRDDERSKMRIVVTLNLYDRIIETGLD